MKTARFTICSPTFTARQGDSKDAHAALARMDTIKRQRAARGVKRVEDPDLSPIESCLCPCGRSLAAKPQLIFRCKPDVYASFLES